MTTHLSLSSIPITAGLLPRCGHPIWGRAGGLTCVREPDHSPGHVYVDSTGSAADDRHCDAGHG